MRVSIGNLLGHPANALNPREEVVHDRGQMPAGSRPQVAQLLDAGNTMSIVPTAILPRNLDARSRGHLAENGARVIDHGCRITTSDIKRLKIGFILLQDQHVGIHNILHMDKVPGLSTVLIDDQWTALHGAAEEYPAYPRIVIVQRLPRTLGDGIAERDSGNSVQPAQTEGGLLPCQLGNRVLVVRVAVLFLKWQGVCLPPTLRAAYFPISPCEFLLRPRLRQNETILWARVLSFPVYSLRGCHNYLHDRKSILHDEFIDQRSAYRVHLKEMRKVRHVVLVGCLVRNHINTLQSFPQSLPVGYAAVNKFNASR